MAKPGKTVPFEGGPELHRFGEPVEVEEEAWRALRAIERGERPEAGDMAALIFKVIGRRNPEVIQRLAAARYRANYRSRRRLKSTPAKPNPLKRVTRFINAF